MDAGEASARFPVNDVTLGADSSEGPGPPINVP
jgi:hypothetical protein